MGGFRKAMPFTFGCFVIGGLALSGVPPFSGFFSKDEILLVIGERGRLALDPLRRRLHRRVPDRDLHVADDLPRLLGRARRPRPRSSSTATCTTPSSRPTRPPARSRTPTSASPAPSTTSPSARWPMKVAMGALAVLADRRRHRADPEDDDVARHVPRADVRGLRRPRRSPSDALLWLGLVLGAVLGLAGIAIAYRIWVRRPGRVARACASASRRCYKLLRQQVVLRRADRPGRRARRSPGSARFGQQTFERVFVNGTLVGGTTGARARRLGRGARRCSPASCAPTPRCCVVGAGRRRSSTSSSSPR